MAGIYILWYFLMLELHAIEFDCVDYHQFARDNSVELARAIESGIPNSLRGMLWQLMLDCPLPLLIIFSTTA